jgi:hypothetical protein
MRRFRKPHSQSSLGKIELLGLCQQSMLHPLDPVGENPKSL